MDEKIGKNIKPCGKELAGQASTQNTLTMKTNRTDHFTNDYGQGNSSPRFYKGSIEEWQDENFRLRAGKASSYDRFREYTQQGSSMYRTGPGMIENNRYGSRMNDHVPEMQGGRITNIESINENYGQGGARNIARFLDESLCWIEAMSIELGTPDHDKTLRMTGAVLQAIRDRVPANYAVELSQPLPLLLKGMYFKDWNISNNPVVIRDKSEFIQFIRDKNREFAREDFADSRDVISALRVVFRVMRRFANPAWVDEMEAPLHKDIRDLIHSPEYEYR